MTQDDVAYFERRMSEERKRAESCLDQAVALIHHQLADHYEAILRESASPSIPEASANNGRANEAQA